jgi:hypothetical protein
MRRRIIQNVTAYNKMSKMAGSNAGSLDFAGGAAAVNKNGVYRHATHGAFEIDSNPIGPGTTLSDVPGFAELDSGIRYQPGHGPAYTRDIIGIQTAFSQQLEAVEMDASGALPVINKKSEVPGQYSPAVAADLPTLRTPAKDAVKQLRRQTRRRPRAMEYIQGNGGVGWLELSESCQPPAY